VLLAMANYLLQSGRYDREFVRRWVNWEETLGAVASGQLEVESEKLKAEIVQGPPSFELFERLLQELYREFTFERAAAEAQVPVERIREAAEYVAQCDGRLATHTWRSASIGNLGGWQVARALFFLNVLTGSVGNPGGTSANSWNKFVPKPFKTPPPIDAWNELHLPDEWPLAHYEMSFLLPHFLKEGRGDIDVYFTRVYNPLWINPDGFVWMDALLDEEKIKCHVALTPTWNESAWFADYVLPMGHAGERHDLMSQETHAGQWIAFRQPVRRVALEKMGQPVRFTYEANPGEVWEENEWWIELSARMDPDGSLGIRQWFESPYRPGEIITVDEYYRWIFENSVPGLPQAAAREGLSPLAYMRKYGAFEVTADNYVPYEKELAVGARRLERGQQVAVDGSRFDVDASGRILKDGTAVGVVVDGEAKVGLGTPSRRFEFFSPTLYDWGWQEREYTIPWPLKSHVHPDNIDREAGEMLLLPNFRLPTLIHTRSANAKWLYEISHKNPVWMHPEDARRLGVKTGDLLRVETEIGYFVDKVWVTEGIKPGVIAMSHHLGRWRLQDNLGGNPGMPISGAHCWLQKATNVRQADPGDKHGDVWVDTAKSMAVYEEWKALTRSAVDTSPDGLRRPLWFKRPLKPTVAAYKLPEKPFGR
jgi:anaerobic selenocysteine-containing dehydrogenase